MRWRNSSASGTTPPRKPVDRDGVHIVGASQMVSDMQIVGAPTYRGSALANGNNRWIEQA